MTKIPYFQRCVTSSWHEANEGVYRLPNDDPAVFEELVNFLYSNSLSYNLAKLIRACPGYDIEYSPEELEISLKSIRLLKIYVMAKRRDFEALQNVILDAVLAGFAVSFVASEEYVYVMDNTVENDMLRKMVLRHVARDMRVDGWEEFKNGEIYVDYVGGNLERMEGIAAALADCKDSSCKETPEERCAKWHVHEETSNCFQE